MNRLELITDTNGTIFYYSEGAYEDAASMSRLRDTFLNLK